MESERDGYNTILKTAGQLASAAGSFALLVRSLFRRIRGHDALNGYSNRKRRGCRAGQGCATGGSESQAWRRKLEVSLLWKALAFKLPRRECHLLSNDTTAPVRRDADRWRGFHAPNLIEELHPPLEPRRVRPVPWMRRQQVAVVQRPVNRRKLKNGYYVRRAMMTFWHRHKEPPLCG